MRRLAWLGLAVASAAVAAGPRISLEGESVPIVDALEVVGGVLNGTITGYYDPEPHMKQMAPFHLRNATPREALAALERATGRHLARSTRLAWVFGGDGGQRLSSRPVGDWVAELNRIEFSHSVRQPLRGEAAPPERARHLVWLLRAPSDPEALGLTDVSPPRLVLGDGTVVEPPATGWFVPGFDVARLDVPLPLNLPPVRSLAEASFTVGLRDVSEVVVGFDLTDASVPVTRKVDDVEVALTSREEGRLRFKVALPAVQPWTDDLPPAPAWRRTEPQVAVECRLFAPDGSAVLTSYATDSAPAPAGQSAFHGSARAYGSYEGPAPARLEVRTYRAVGPRRATTARWTDLPLPPLSVPPPSGLPVVVPRIPPLPAPPALATPKG